MASVGARMWATLPGSIWLRLAQCRIGFARHPGARRQVQRRTFANGDAHSLHFGFARQRREPSGPKWLRFGAEAATRIRFVWRRGRDPELASSGAGAATRNWLRSAQGRDAEPAGPFVSGPHPSAPDAHGQRSPGLAFRGFLLFVYDIPVCSGAGAGPIQCALVFRHCRVCLVSRFWHDRIGDGVRWNLGFSSAAGHDGIGQLAGFAANHCTSISAPEERTLASGIFTSGISVAALIAPGLILAIFAATGWRGAFMVVGALGFVNFTVAFFHPPA